jgi:hypothetical protein
MGAEEFSSVDSEKRQIKFWRSDSCMAAVAALRDDLWDDLLLAAKGSLSADKTEPAASWEFASNAKKVTILPQNPEANLEKTVIFCSVSAKTSETLEFRELVVIYETFFLIGCNFFIV